MARARSKKQRKLRRSQNKPRTTVRAVYNVLRKYPGHTGASVRTIHRLISRNQTGRSRRSLSSVKMAISRAVGLGTIRAPHGWSGFRGMPSARRTSGRQGRNPKARRRSSHHAAARRKSSARKTRRKSSVRKSSNRRRSSARRSYVRSKTPRKAGGYLSTSRRGAVFRVRRGRRSRGRRWRPRSPCQVSDRSNSSHANVSDNYSSPEDSEGQTVSLWHAHTCVIS